MTQSNINTTGIFCDHGPKNWSMYSEQQPPLPCPLLTKRLAVKDLFAVKGFKNSAGNPDWLATHDVASTTAASVQTLMDDGCTFVGFTHTDEIAYSLEGNNVHFGIAENPKLAGHMCGGSSMGSAAAVAANMADIGLGTDTGGSIRIPASYCGLFGIRPSQGQVSTKGLTGLAPEFDTIGWFTHHADLLAQVGDSLLLPQTIKKVDTLLSCEALFDLVEPNYRPALDANLSHVAANFESHKTLNIDSNLLAELPDAFRILQGRGIAKEHKAWVDQASPTFSSAIQQRFTMAFALTEQEEQEARLVQAQLQQLISTHLSDTSCLFLPTTPTSAPKIGEDISALRMQLINLSAVAGLTGSAQVHLPLTVMPVEINKQPVPYGFSLMMRSGQDKSLLALVNRLSQHSAWKHI